MAVELVFVPHGKVDACVYECGEEIVLIFDYARHPKFTGHSRYEIRGMVWKDTLIEAVAYLMEQGLWPDD